MAHRNEWCPAGHVWECTSPLCVTQGNTICHQNLSWSFRNWKLLKQTEAAWTLKEKVRGCWIPFFLCLPCTWPWPHRGDGSWGEAALWALGGTIKLGKGYWTIQVAPCKRKSRLWIREMREGRSNRCHPQMGLQSKHLERNASMKSARFVALLQCCPEP